MIYPETHWQTATPAAQGVDPDKLAEALRFVESMAGPDGIKQALVIRNGYLIWQNHDIDNRHIIWSCTKSFLSTCLGLLWDDGKNPQAPDLEIIIRHTLQAQKVLNDLMRFARSKPETGVIDLTEAMAFIARVFHVRADKMGIQIVTDVQSNLPKVRGDEAAVEQILSNIVINSIDALEEHPDMRPGRIALSALSDRKTNEVILTVMDNGPGIPESYLSRVFDPFFTTKEVGRGTGLGLSVVYGLVKDMEGRIEVHNHDGAIFTITFKATGEKTSDDPTL